MIVVSPGHHPEADKAWKELLGSKPNGARTLGDAQAKYFTSILEPYYDMLVTYASDYKFEIPEGVKRIAVMWHQNFPWTEGFKVWQRVNNRLLDYEVDYFVNEKTLVGLIKEVYPRVFYLPRFIDSTQYPKIECEKDIDTLWFGNKWNEFKAEFFNYNWTQDKPYWVCHGRFGIGDEEGKLIKNRLETLTYVARAKRVWAIGISQLEARHYGAQIVSYRGLPCPYYNERTIQTYLKKLMKEVNE